MRYFCTYFDHRFLSRGLALYRSLAQHCPEFTLWILCLDQPCHAALSELHLPHVRPISLNEFEVGDAPLLATKQHRSLIEYYFTCTPSLPLFIFHRAPAVDLLTYVDADLYFYASPEALFDEMGNRSIAIIPHRFPPHLKSMEANGLFNVAWLSFRRDEPGLACLRWWRERCLEWCYDRVEEHRFADQKYLNEWPARFASVAVLNHKGGNLAPWNFCSHRIHVHEDRVMVDDQPLIFFHFQGFKQLGCCLFDTNTTRYETRPTSMVLRHIFGPYIRALQGGSSTTARVQGTTPTLLRLVCRLMRRNYFFAFNGRVL